MLHRPHVVELSSAACHLSQRQMLFTPFGDTWQVFESIGPVVELVVVRDKFTHESKGSAFVWYRTKADTDQVRTSS